MSCTRPSLLVCESVTDEGVCRRPTTTLEGGRGYTLFATGTGMPTGRVTIRVHGERTGGRASDDRRVVEVSESARSVTAPLRLLYEGDYRISVVDGDGDEFRSTTVHVTRPVIRPIAPFER